MVQIQQIFLLIALLPFFGAAQGGNTFVVPHTPGQDDAPALLAGLQGFTSDSTILFQRGTTYNIFSPVKFPVLKNVEIRIEGNITYPTDIPTIQGMWSSMPF